jgi:hypothetical protein
MNVLRFIINSIGSGVSFIMFEIHGFRLQGSGFRVQGSGSMIKS